MLFKALIEDIILLGYETVWVGNFILTLRKSLPHPCLVSENYPFRKKNYRATASSARENYDLQEQRCEKTISRIQCRREKGVWRGGAGTNYRDPGIDNVPYVIFLRSMIFVDCTN